MEDTHPFIANRMALSPEEIRQINESQFKMVPKPPESVVYHLPNQGNFSATRQTASGPNVM